MYKYKHAFGSSASEKNPKQSPVQYMRCFMFATVYTGCNKHLTHMCDYLSLYISSQTLNLIDF